MTDTSNIITAETTKSLFGKIYFWRTPTGLSERKAIKLPIPRNTPTSKADSSWSQKKKTRVKWKHIQTNDDMNPYVKKFFLLISSKLLSVETKLIWDCRVVFSIKKCYDIRFEV